MLAQGLVLAFSSAAAEMPLGAATNRGEAQRPTISQTIAARGDAQRRLCRGPSHVGSLVFFRLRTLWGAALPVDDAAMQ